MREAGAVSKTTSHEHKFVPGLGRGPLTPLYDLVHRLSGIGGVHADMIRLAALTPGQRVLDVGCGTGNLLLALGRDRSDLVLTGLDPDARALALAARKARRKRVAVAWQRGFAQELPHPDGSVDRVFSSLMLHHLDDAAKGALLAEVRRVLRPDGLLVLADIDGHHAIRGHGPFGRRMAASALVRDNAGMVGRIQAAGFTVEPPVTHHLRMGAITIVPAHA